MVFLINIAMLQNIFSEAMAYLPILAVTFVLCLLILTKSIQYFSRSAIYFLFCIGIFLCGTFILEIVYRSYLSANLTYANALCAVVFIMGYSSGDKISSEDIRKIFLFYILGTLIVSVIVYLRFYVGFQWGLRYSEYKFRGQLSQSIMFSVFAMITIVKFNSKFLKIIKGVLYAFFSILLLMMKCRAALVEIVIGIIVMFFFKGTSKKVKRTILALIIAFFVVLLFKSDLQQIIINDVLFYGRDMSDLDDISSGRMTILASFPDLWTGHELTGIGNYYFECFPLNALLQYGIFVGSIAIIIGYYPALWILKNRHFILDKELCVFFLMSSIASVVCGFFEAIAPVGPGIKFFFLWMMFGILMSKQDMSQKRIIIDE